MPVMKGHGMVTSAPWQKTFCLFFRGTIPHPWPPARPIIMVTMPSDDDMTSLGIYKHKLEAERISNTTYGRCKRSGGAP